MNTIIQHNNFPYKKKRQFTLKDVNNVEYQIDYKNIQSPVVTKNDITIPLYSIGNALSQLTKTKLSREQTLTMILNNPKCSTMDFYLPYLTWKHMDVIYETNHTT